MCRSQSGRATARPGVVNGVSDVSLCMKQTPLSVDPCRISCSFKQ